MHHELFATIEKRVAARVNLTGDRIERMIGVNGEWRLRLQFDTGTTFKIQLKPPRGVESMKIMYSMKAIRIALSNTNEGRCATAMRHSDAPCSVSGYTTCTAVHFFAHDFVGCTGALTDGICNDYSGGEELAYTPRHDVAATRIQVMYRKYTLTLARRQSSAQYLIMEKSRENLQRVNELILIAEKECATLNRLYEHTDRMHTAFTQAARFEEALRARHSDVALMYPPLVYEIPVADEHAVKDLSSLVTRTTDTDRDIIGDYAKGICETEDEDSLAYRCARAIRTENHYPFIVGELPLPASGKYVWKHDGASAYIMVTDTLSTNHHSLHLTKFAATWAEHCASIPSHRDVCIIDMFTDANFSDYTGSMIISKFLLRRWSKYIPAIHIDSIVTYNHGKGYGKRMIELCKAFLFSDGADVSTGIIFAQCLDLNFWEYRLSPSPRAQMLIMQMVYLYDDYDFEEECVMRMTEYDNVDDSKPSPVRAIYTRL